MSSVTRIDCKRDHATAFSSFFQTETKRHCLSPVSRFRHLWRKRTSSVALSAKEGLCTRQRPPGRDSWRHTYAENNIARTIDSLFRSYLRSISLCWMSYSSINKYTIGNDKLPLSVCCHDTEPRLHFRLQRCQSRRWGKRSFRSQNPNHIKSTPRTFGFSHRWLNER
jgi:hypothetical protein